MRLYHVLRSMYIVEVFFINLNLPKKNAEKREE